MTTKNLKKVLLVVGLSLGTIIASCSSESEKKTLKVGTILSSSHPVNVALKNTFAKMVEEKSD